MIQLTELGRYKITLEHPNPSYADLIKGVVHSINATQVLSIGKAQRHVPTRIIGDRKGSEFYFYMPKNERQKFENRTNRIKYEIEETSIVPEELLKLL